MRRLIWAVLLLAAANESAPAQSLDVMLWVPPSERASAAPAKVLRNKSYYAVKLKSAYASYDAGALSDVNRLIVSSQTLSADPGYIGRSTVIHKMWQRADRRGDLVPIDDYLVAFSPAVASEVVVKIGLRGLADEEAYKPVLESLTEPGLKASLSLTPATAPSIAGLTLGVEKFLAPPYLATEGKQALEIERTFIVEEESVDAGTLPPGAASKNDGLREGYAVLVSSNEKPNDELAKIKTLPPKDLRISAKNALEYKDGAAWKPFRKNSYVVLAVNRSAFRGIDDSAPWAKKYIESTKHFADKDDANAVSLWREANTLLAADTAYTAAEREAIKAFQYQKLADEQKTRNAPAPALDLPNDFAGLARSYPEQATTAAQLIVESKDEKNKPRPGIYFRLVGLDAPTYASRDGRTNQEGLFTFKTLVPGKYVFEVWLGGEQPEKRVFVFEPKETKRIAFVIPNVYVPVGR